MADRSDITAMPLSLDLLFSCCPFCSIAQICRELPYKLMPNYSNLRVMFRTLYARQGFMGNAAWDWEIAALADMRAQCGPLEFHMSEQVRCKRALRSECLYRPNTIHLRLKQRMLMW